MSDDKIFSEQEATELVLSAAKMQEEEPESTDVYVPGIRLGELKRMAKELGVEEKYLLKAVEAKTGQAFGGGAEPGRQKGFLGMEWYRHYEAVVDGELPPEHFDIVVEELQGTGGAVQGGSAVSAMVGRMIEGTMAKGMGHGSLKVVSRNGRTRIVAKSDFTMPFLTTAFPAMLVSMVLFLTAAVGKVMLPWVAFGLGVAILLAGIIVSGYLAPGGHRRIGEQFRKIVDKIEAENESLRGRLEGATSSVEEEVADRLRAD